MAKIVEIRGVVDAHVHLRDGELMETVAPISASYCSAMLVMPNDPQIFTGEEALKYAGRIRASLDGAECELLMSVKLDNEVTTPTVIREASEAGVAAAKAYPIGTTTGADITGVSDFTALTAVFEEMERVGMVLSLHGETASPDFVLKREKKFLPTLVWLSKTFPELRIVLEHITTRDAVGIVCALPKNVAATITAHHLYDTLDVVIGGLLNPHAFCKPVHKRPKDRKALRAAAMYDSGKFFFGSDSAPLSRDKKECADGCAGAFTAPSALQMITSVFANEIGSDAHLKKFLQRFLAENARSFYNLPPSDKPVTLARESYEVPAQYEAGEGIIIPYRAGATLSWSYISS